MSHVRCHVSGAMHHVSHVWCQMSYVRFFTVDKVVGLDGGGFVINRAYPVQFLNIQLHSTCGFIQYRIDQYLKQNKNKYNLVISNIHGKTHFFADQSPYKEVFGTYIVCYIPNCMFSKKASLTKQRCFIKVRVWLTGAQTFVIFVTFTKVNKTWKSASFRHMPCPWQKKVEL